MLLSTEAEQAGKENVCDGSIDSQSTCLPRSGTAVCFACQPPSVPASSHCKRVNTKVVGPNHPQGTPQDGNV